MATDKNVLKVLKTARGLLAKGWTDDCFAVNKKGDEVPVKSDDAVAFCAVGALRRAEFKLGTKGVATQARATLRKFLPKNKFGRKENSLIMFNDSRGKKEVLELFDTAITNTK